jgi:DNA-binding transcriptional MocR family regulator
MTVRYVRMPIELEGTYVGAGHCFELPEVCFRLGYGWPTPAELEAGLRAISRALRG